MGLTEHIKDGDWRSVRSAIAKLGSLKLGPTATPTFAGMTFTAPLTVPSGGTGLATLTDHGLLLGSGTGVITPLGVATNGQIPIGSTGADPVLATITGTTNQVNIANAAGSITLSTPQDIHTSAAVNFYSLTLSYLFAADGVVGNPSITLAGSTDTGIYAYDYSGDDLLSVAHNGVAMFRFGYDGIWLKDSLSNVFLTIIPGGTKLTGRRILTLDMGDAARTISLTGNPTLADWFNQSVKSGDAPTFIATNFSDGGSNAIITTTQETNFETAYTHSQDSSQAHSDYLINNGDDSTSGALTVGSLISGVITGSGLHTINQTADDIGLQINGFDDKSGVFFKAAVTANGDVALDASQDWYFRRSAGLKLLIGSSYLTKYVNSEFRYDSYKAYYGELHSRGYLNYAGGSAQYVAVSTPQNFSFVGYNQIKVEASISLKEQAAAGVDAAGYGQLWTKDNAGTTELWFTDDGGGDHQIAYV